MNKIKFTVNVALLMIIASMSIYSQKNVHDFSRVQKFSKLTEGIISPVGSRSNLDEVIKQNRKSSSSYKLLENGYVLESIQYQLYTANGWLDYQTELNTYDNNFNLIETVTQYFSGMGLENYERITQTYYPDNQLETKLVQYWNGSEWEDDNKSVYTYDSQKRYSEIIYLLSDGAGGFLEFTRDLHSYSTNPKKETVESQQFANGGWENLSLTEGVYLDEERLQELTISGWNGFEYVFNEKSVYTYSNGLLTETLSSLWSGTEWVDAAKQSYSYDIQERMLEYLSQSYNDTTQSWENVYKMTNTYYGNDSLMTIAQSGNANTWENLFKVINSYYADGNLKSTVSYDWVSPDWLPLAKGEYEYNTNGNPSIYLEYVFEDNDWSVYGRAIYTFIPANPTNVDDDIISAEEFKLYDNYPNPFNPSTVISWQSSVDSRQTLKIFDILGKEVATLVDEFRSAGKHSVEFDASGLASGIYMYTITSQSLDGRHNFTAVKKMMLMK
jgi:hypothetical protein